MLLGAVRQVLFWIIDDLLIRSSEEADAFDVLGTESGSYDASGGIILAELGGDNHVRITTILIACDLDGLFPGSHRISEFLFQRNRDVFFEVSILIRRRTEPCLDNREVHRSQGARVVKERGMEANDDINITLGVDVSVIAV